LEATNKFAAVAIRIEVSPRALRSALDEVAAERNSRYATITVRGVQHGRMAAAWPGTVLWRVAEILGIEPEDLRDAIAAVYQPEPGKVAALTHRRGMGVGDGERASRLD
jgi:hypothetical protein